MFRDIASAIIGALLSVFKEETINTAKSNFLQNSMEKARGAILTHVAEQYSKEVQYNISQYIRSLEVAEVEISFEGKPGEALITRAQNAVSEIESYLEAQNPDGPIIQFLKQRYNEEGIRIITGRLYAGHYVSRKTQGVYEVMNIMGYAAPVDTRKPWLSSDKTASGIEDIVTRVASEMFDLAFDGVDLSSELANITFSGEGVAALNGDGTIRLKDVVAKQVKKRSKRKK